MPASTRSERKNQLANAFRALADPNRLAIFQLVCERGAQGQSEDAGNTVSRLAAEFDLTLSTVSHHLRELKNAGLIRCEKVGQSVHCVPAVDLLEDVERFLEELKQ
ncbi:MAG TPA: metalloregulator ArsR/SmtB family transcription factor [Gaiellaceae bacterium]